MKQNKPKSGEQASNNIHHPEMSELGKLKLERERLSLLYVEKSKTSKLKLENEISILDQK